MLSFLYELSWHLAAKWRGTRIWSDGRRTGKRDGGQKYYIEVLHKEGNGGDNIVVGWNGPGIATTTVIESSYLSPFTQN